MRTGIANLPLHSGFVPRWLFEKMTRLAKEITIAIVSEFSPQTFLSKLADPYPVDRQTYEKSIEVLRIAIRRAKIGQREKIEALKQLSLIP